jgi:signal transduction histidine kinase
VGWTEIIGREEPLPPPGPADTRGVKEFTLLRDALRTMADDLEEGRKEAIQAAKLRSWTDMARKVAHELKNPLAPMRMAATTVSGSSDAGSQAAGAVLLEEIARLDEMARTFSQFGRMPEGPPSEVDLVELLQLLLDQHEGVGPTLDFQPPAELPLVTAHYDAILRSFRNLLLNAIDASGDGGRVEVRAWTKESMVKVEIRDSGPGLPSDALEEIWEPEFTTKSRGTGLGLPLVRQTIAFHRGRVEGRNNPEGGAVFLVELPVQGPQAHRNGA